MNPATPPASDTSSLHCDFLVVGSGAGGLAAAVTAAHQGLHTLVLEKENVLGGTTAWSGVGYGFRVIPWPGAPEWRKRWRRRCSTCTA
ncbi:MAG: FAD-binding protein [Thiolinea sp.]